MSILSFLGMVEAGLSWSFNSRFFCHTVWFVGCVPFRVFPCPRIGELESEWVAEGLEEAGVEVRVLRNSGKVGVGDWLL